MIEEYLHKNIVQWLSTDIEFNDMIRCIVNPAGDILNRYEVQDKFFKHVDDIAISGTENQNFLYPFLGFDYILQSLPVRSECAARVDIRVGILSRPCNPDDCSFISGECSISVPDPRAHISQIRDYIIGLFFLEKLDGDNNTIITNLFNELSCSTQPVYDCETQTSVDADWNYSMTASLDRNPIVSKMESRPDGIVQQFITIPILVHGMIESCDLGCEVL